MQPILQARPGGREVGGNSAGLPADCRWQPWLYESPATEGLLPEELDEHEYVPTYARTPILGEWDEVDEDCGVGWLWDQFIEQQERRQARDRARLAAAERAAERNAFALRVQAYRRSPCDFKQKVASEIEHMSEIDRRAAVDARWWHDCGLVA